MKICKNKITDSIRELFNANPLRIPESRIQPLTLLEIEDKKAKYLGAFKYLVKGGFEHQLPIEESYVAEVSDKKTKQIDFNFGVQILGNFIKAFGTDPASFTAAFSKTKKISFSFSNVKRRYFEPLQFGQILSAHEIIGDPENFFIKEIIKNDKIKLALITDVLVSNNFILSSYSENDTEIDIDIKTIEDYLGGLNTDIKVEKVKENEVKVTKGNPLSFAFSCVELVIDPNSGRFSRGEWINNIRSAKGKEIIESELSQQDWNDAKMILDDNLANPLLLDFE